MAVKPGLNYDAAGNAVGGTATEEGPMPPYDTTDPATDGGDGGTSEPYDPCQASLDAANSKIAVYARMYAEANNLLNAKCPSATGGADPAPWTADCAGNLAATREKLYYYVQELGACQSGANSGRDPATPTCKCAAIAGDCAACEQKLADVSKLLSQKCPADGGGACTCDVSQYKDMITDLRKRLEIASSGGGGGSSPAADCSSYKDTISQLTDKLNAVAGGGAPSVCDYSKYSARITDLQKKLADGCPTGAIGPDGQAICPVLDCPMCPLPAQCMCAPCACPDPAPCPAIAQVAPCPADSAPSDDQVVADLKAKVAALTKTVAERDATIKALRTAQG